MTKHNEKLLRTALTHEAYSGCKKTMETICRFAHEQEGGKGELYIRHSTAMTFADERQKPEVIVQVLNKLGYDL